MASILIVSGPHEGQYHPLRRRTVIIGRDDGSTIQLVDSLVSRSHVEIACDDEDVWRIRDLGSVNGTRLNDRDLRVTTSLTDGDLIQAGNSSLMFSQVDFTDRETAFEQYRQRGQHGRSTSIQQSDD